jgi:hypothetical protein
MTLSDEIGNINTNGMGDYEEVRGIELGFPLSRVGYEEIGV